MSRLENGFVYLWALFAVVLAGIVMAGTGQMWQTKSQREKEMQLMYVGEEFRKAIMSYYNSSGGAKQYPESLEDLLQDSRTPAIKRHLRKIYVDPVTNTAEWGIVEESQADNSAASKGKQTTPSGNQTSNTSGQASNSNPASTAGGKYPVATKFLILAGRLRAIKLSTPVDKYLLATRHPIAQHQAVA